MDAYLPVPAEEVRRSTITDHGETVAPAVRQRMIAAQARSKTVQATGIPIPTAHGTVVQHLHTLLQEVVQVMVAPHEVILQVQDHRAAMAEAEAETNTTT